MEHVSEVDVVYDDSGYERETNQRRSQLSAVGKVPHIAIHDLDEAFPGRVHQSCGLSQSVLKSTILDFQDAAIKVEQTDILAVDLVSSCHVFEDQF